VAHGVKKVGQHWSRGSFFTGHSVVASTMDATEKRELVLRR